MPAEIATAIIAASGAILLAGASYWFTKKREADAKLRKEKLEHYKEFASTLSAVSFSEFTAEDQHAFARACNKLNLVAPQAVLRALQTFQREIKVAGAAERKHEKLISALFYEIRKDLGMSPKDTEASFHVQLWTAGTSSNGP